MPMSKLYTIIGITEQLINLFPISFLMDVKLLLKKKNHNVDSKVGKCCSRNY